jgi:hypothetical protein
MLLSRVKKLDEALEESSKAIASAPTIARFVHTTPSQRFEG